MYAFTRTTGETVENTRFIRVAGGTGGARVTGGVRFASVARIKRRP